jgi:molecular chaperone DnaJ
MKIAVEDSVNFLLDRSLTKRQREILQLYVDDLEGRNPAQSQTPQSTPSDNSTTDDSPADDNRDNNAARDNNGTTPFPHPSPSPTGGWMSYSLQRIRRLIGI